VVGQFEFRVESPSLSLLFPPNEREEQAEA
jgi:hypothetical protein